VTIRSFAIASLLALGCGPRLQPSDPTAPAATAPAATTAPAGPLFVVPRDGAIVEVDAEGRLVRTIARVPAQDVLPLPGGAFLAHDGGTLRRVRSDGTVDLTVALPATGRCRDAESDSSLFPQSGMTVDHDGRVAHAIMAELDYDAMFNVEVTICLDSGRVYANPETISDGCTLAPAPILGPPPCVANSDPSAPSENPDEDLSDPHAQQYGFDVQDANVVRREGDRVTVVSGPLLAYESTAVRSISPSGRWLLLQGPEFAATSLYHFWLLFDRQTGEVYVLPEEATARWPAPMGARAFAEPGREVGWHSYTTRPLRWHPSGGDLLQVDQLLIRPGERVIDLGGRPAYED
jgi:hypothetical protein